MCSSEIWRDIEGYEGKYQVSNLGRVRSLDRYVKQECGPSHGEGIRFHRGTVLKQTMASDGYFRVSLYDKNGRLHYTPVHLLVAHAFLKGYKEGMQVNHINEMKFVNCAINLEWVTPSQNINHGSRNTRAVATRSRHSHFPKVLQQNDEGITICEYNSQKEAAEVNGINRTLISRAMRDGIKIKGYYWKFKE
jgi:hypothetical protein